VSDSVADLWKAFLASGTKDAEEAAGAPYESWAFCGGGPMADELVELVLAGTKRATAGALWSYEHEGAAIPQPGDFSVVFDARGVARCVIRATQCDVVPFGQVSAEFAAAEGEGDLSLEYWRKGHWRFFTAELAEFGRVPEADMPVVCERFEVVFSAEQATA